MEIISHGYKAQIQAEVTFKEIMNVHRDHAFSIPITHFRKADAYLQNQQKVDHAPKLPQKIVQIKEEYYTYTVRAVVTKYKSFSNAVHYETSSIRLKQIAPKKFLKKTTNENLK